MAKIPDQTFFRNLVLQCLDYLPMTLQRETLIHLDIETLRSVSAAVNIVRSDYYSFFMPLITNIPEEDYKDLNCLASQVSCLDLEDKNEEFLLLCSILIQVAHYVVLKHRCFEMVHVAARCLNKVFDQKYRDRCEITDCEEFLSHCVATVHQRSEIDSLPDRRNRVIKDLLEQKMCWCRRPKEKNVLDFWDKINLRLLEDEANKEKGLLAMRWAGELQEAVFVRPYLPYLKRRIDDYRKLDEPEADKKNCQKTSFCLGCFLTISYPGVKEEKAMVKHDRFCPLWTEKIGVDDADAVECEEFVREREHIMSDLCATQVARLPELVLNFVQDHLDYVSGSCAVKQVRHALFQELNVKVDTCQHCKTKCVKKLIICMDLYAEGCEQRPESFLWKKPRWTKLSRGGDDA